MRSTARTLTLTAAVCFSIATLLGLPEVSEAAKKEVAGISQSKALDGGVTPGDDPGFPVTISEPGSYQLITNLEVPDENTTAIDIVIEDVSIDLNGFAIFGPNVSGYGAGVVAFGKANVVVRNGSIVGMGGYGIFLYNFATVEDVRVIGSGGTGIRVSLGSRVTRCTSSQNGSAGIWITASQVSECSLVQNEGSGIFGSGAVTGCTVDRNMTYGIDVNGDVSNNYVHLNGGNTSFPSAGIRSQGTVIGNHIISHKGNGIETSNAGSLVKDNTVMFNDGDGVHDVNGPSTVIGNHISANKGYGLFLHAESGYANNLINTSPYTPPAPVSGGVAMGTNICDGSPCP